MNRFAHVTSRVAIAAVALVLSMNAATAVATPPDAATLDRMDTVIRRGMDNSGIPGFAIAVVSSGRVVHARGYGEAGSDRKVTAQTPFVLGSTTKSFTALAAMQLADAGALDLEAPARRYVPEFELADRNATDSITVRQVLQQTTGIPESAGGSIVRSAADGTALEALEELRDTKLASTPGSEFAYSNANFILAGLIVERASGEPYGDYVTRHIFEPLGMDHSYVGLDAARADGLATGHRYWFGIATAHGPTVRAGIQSAGYLISSAGDMARYLAMYLNEGRAPDQRQIVSRRGLRTMFAPARSGTLGPWADNADTRYAMGWYAGGPWSETALLHPGRAPDSSALIAIFPARELAVVTLVNAANELPLPGYPASVDRVERNAVDALIGDPVDAGTSLRRFYLYFDLVTVILLLGLAWPLYRAVRALRAREAPRHRVRAVAAVAARAVVGLAITVLPALTIGWPVALLWSPDLTLVFALAAALLLTTAGLRLALLLRTAAPAVPEGEGATVASAHPRTGPAGVAGALRSRRNGHQPVDGESRRVTHPHADRRDKTRSDPGGHR